MKELVILGGGISGLAAAWYLREKFPDLLVLEKSDRVGRWIRSTQEGDFLFELGPRGFRPKGKGAVTLKLIEELGLSSELIGANRCAKARYLSLGGKLKALSPLLMLKHGLLRGLMKDLFVKKCVEDDETIEAFFVRRMNREFAQTFMDPLTKGIFGGSAASLSVKSCFPFLWKADQAYGSLLKGFFKCRQRKKTSLPPLYSFKKGMETLPKTLGEKLGDCVRLSCEVEKIEPCEGGYRILLANEVIETKRVVCALPAYALGELYSPLKPFVKDFTFQTLSTVSMGWNAPMLKKRGFGFLVPTFEKSDILGMTWDSEIFPEQPGQTRICTMIQGDVDLEAKAQGAVAHYLKIDRPCDAISIQTARQAIPQYTLGHEKKVLALQEALPEGMHIIGNSYWGIGINDCISQAANLKGI